MPDITEHNYGADVADSNRDVTALRRRDGRLVFDEYRGFGGNPDIVRRGYGSLILTEGRPIGAVRKLPRVHAHANIKPVAAPARERAKVEAQRQYQKEKYKDYKQQQYEATNKNNPSSKFQEYQRKKAEAELRRTKR